MTAYKEHIPQNGKFSGNHHRRSCWQAVANAMNALPADVRGGGDSLTEGYIRQAWANKVKVVKRRLQELSGSTPMTPAELMCDLGTWAQHESVVAALLECARGARRDTNKSRRKQSGTPGSTNAGISGSMHRSGENASVAVPSPSSAKRKRDSVRAARDPESQWDDTEPTPEEVQQSRALRSLMKDVNGRRRAKRATTSAQMLALMRASHAQTESWMKEVSQAVNLIRKKVDTFFKTPQQSMIHKSVLIIERLLPLIRCQDMNRAHCERTSIR